MVTLEGESQVPEKSVSWDYGGELIAPDSLASELLREISPMMAASLHYEVVAQRNLAELKGLNAVLFPMVYQDKYYKEVLAQDSLARLGKAFSHPYS